MESDTPLRAILSPQRDRTDSFDNVSAPGGHGNSAGEPGGQPDDTDDKRCLL